MSLSKPRFSVVIPCYNESLYLKQTLESLKNQSYRGQVEIIVVDNNSSDQTAEIAKASGVKVIYEKNPGVTSARQSGTHAARGEIIVSTDADTVFTNNWLEKINSTFEKNGSCIAVAGPCQYVDSPAWGKVYPKLLFGAVSLKYRLTGKPFYITATNIAFKKSAWTDYDTALTQGGDELDLLRNLKTKGHVVFDNSNPTLTSARRLKQGFLYNFVVTFLIYYILAYNLNRLLKRTVLGTVPAYRTEPALNYNRSLSRRVALTVFAVVALAWIPMKSDAVLFTHDAFDTAGVVLKALM